MDLPTPLAWLVDEAGTSAGPERFLAELGGRLLADGLPLAGGALSLAVPHPIIARRIWLWRAETGTVIESLGFAGRPPSQAGHDWLAGLGPMQEDTVGSAADSPVLGWAGTRPFGPAETGALRRGTGETIRAALLCADLRDFTALSEATEPTAMIAALDAWFDRVAGAVHAFGGEVLKFIGDGVLAIFPVTGAPGDACEAALRAVAAARAGMAHLDTVRQAQGLPPLPFGAALHFGEMLWGNIGAADRLDFTAIGPAVNLVSRLEGLCKPLGRSVLISGAVATQTSTTLISLGEHPLRGIAAPCAVFTLPED
jgi:adenylate cyclase